MPISHDTLYRLYSAFPEGNTVIDCLHSLCILEANIKKLDVYLAHKCQNVETIATNETLHQHLRNLQIAYTALDKDIHNVLSNAVNK